MVSHVHSSAAVGAVVGVLVAGAGFALGAVAVSGAGSLGVGLLLAVPGIELLAVGGALALRAFTFGVSILTLETRPGVIGGELAGVVGARLPRLEPGHRLKVRLSCRRVVPGGTAKILWHSEYAVGGEAWRRSGGRVEIPCWFRIPRGLPETGSPESAPRHVWLLEVTTTTIRGPYAARFPVPVVRPSRPPPLRRAAGS